MSDVVLLPQRRAQTDPNGHYLVRDRRRDGRTRELARFVDPREAIAYANSLRTAGAVVSIEVVLPTEGPDAA
jgi:hypothetical protein